MANRDELAVIRGARAGQAQAQLALGKRYLFGSTGLPQNPLTALHWLDRAAQQGMAEAWQLIGQHISYEVAGRTEQPLQLCSWYDKAFDDGIVPAGLVLAQLVLAQQEAPHALQHKAQTALAAAARAGLAQAQWLLAQQQQARPVEASEADWTVQAAKSGVAEAQYAVMEKAWQKADWAGFLHWALPVARELAGQFDTVSEKLTPEQVQLLVRCAEALARDEAQAVPREPQDQPQRFWEVAAQCNDRQAQLWIGLWYARMDEQGERASNGVALVNFKKAIRWLTLAGEQGSAIAWFALSRIFMKAEFSQRNLVDALGYMQRAAEMGHAMAQWECGSMIWRNRRDAENQDITALYWLQKAASQGIEAARELLEKVAPRVGPQLWAQQAGQMLTRDMINSHPFLAARVELALMFGLSRAEALLLDIHAADQGHCLLIDIRHHYARSRRRLAMVDGALQRQALDRITRLFLDVDGGPTGPEGNYRQRVYRLKTLLPQLDMAQAA
jgi:TPR repeat protein